MLTLVKYLSKNAPFNVKPTNAFEKSEILSERNLFQFTKYAKRRFFHKNLIVPGKDTYKNESILSSPKHAQPKESRKLSEQQHGTLILENVLDINFSKRKTCICFRR